MAGDVVIERLNLEGILKGVSPEMQQAIFGLLFTFIGFAIQKGYFMFGLISYLLGAFLVADLFVSKTIGWEKVFPN